VPETPPIERALFREAEDGAIVFFPWGLGHRGYRLPDEAARKKAARAASLLIGSTLAVATWTAHVLQPLVKPEGGDAAELLRGLVAPVAALVLAIFAYWAWTSRFVEGLRESDLSVSREERLREAAEAVAPWKIAVIGLLLAGMSGLVAWLEPRAWWLGLLGVAMGLGLVLWSVALRRAATGPAA
jgi:hypothetical protein